MEQLIYSRVSSAKIFIGPKDSDNWILFLELNNLIKQMEAKIIWKIRQLTLHFWKATKERVAWYQTILYSLAESLILEDISGFWLTFMYLFCVRGTNYKPNVFRTEMYKTISANKSSTFWKQRPIQKPNILIHNMYFQDGSACQK